MLYMRCRCEQLLSASRKRLEAARVCAFAGRISTFASTTLKLLATTLCGAVMADGVATIPSIRPNGARGADFRINWPRPCKARARGGKLRALWRRNSLRKRLRFARNGGPHRNARRIGGRCLSDRDSFVQAYIVSILLLFFCVNLHWKEVGTCLLYTSPSPRDGLLSRMPSSA